MRADEDARHLPASRPRRRSDRVAGLAGWALGAAALAVLLLSVLAGFRSFGDLTHRAADEQRDRTPLTAVLVQDAVGLTGTTPDALAAVRWTEADGIERTGVAEVQGRPAAGTPVPVWVTSDHRLAGAPLTRPEIGVVAALAAGGVLAVGGALVALLGRLAFAGVARLRGAEWEREWARVEPRWAGR